MMQGNTWQITIEYKYANYTLYQPWRNPFDDL